LVTIAWGFMVRGLEVLALSVHDLRAPIHGSARLALSMIGALALKGVNVTYVRLLSGKSELTRIITTSRYGDSSFLQLSLPYMRSTSTREYLLRLPNMVDIRKIIANVCQDSDVVLCLDRKLFPLCKYLSMHLRAPLILSGDALKYLVTFESLTPIARLYYALAMALSNITITITKKLEEEAKNLSLLGNLLRIQTLRPTFMLLKDDFRDGEREALSSLPESLVLYSGSPSLLKFLAKKLSHVNFVVTGPQAYYAKIAGLDRFRNVYLLHNISDRALAELHRYITCAVVHRDAMTGISITILQEMYFGKPVIANSTAALGFEDAVESGLVLIAEESRSYVDMLQHLLSNEEALYKLSTRIIEFFDRKLSPMIYAEKLYRLIQSL